jgi:uncharacterized SAM-binding protein YcdF (DUF218 family)
MQLFLIIFGIAVILIFLEPVFEDVFNLATIVGITVGSFPLFIGILWKSLNEKLKLILLIVYAVGFVIMLVLMSIILLCGKTKATTQNAVIVLGCSVKGDKPSLSLIKRVDTAYSFLLKNKGSVAILSGGKGPDENISEAVCMKNMLLEKGISSERLLIDDKSTTTDENIRFSLKLINDYDLSKNVAIASSEYHQLRAKMICSRYGLTAFAQSSKTKISILPTFLLREIFAIIKEKLRH